MYDVKKSIDVELNVQLVYTALIHEYAYEGPCRFGPPEALTQEFDLMNQAEIFKMWTQGYGGALSHIPGIHLLDPLYIKMSDEFFITEEEEQKLQAIYEKQGELRKAKSIAISLAQEGESVERIARILGETEKTIKEWMAETH